MDRGSRNDPGDKIGMPDKVGNESGRRRIVNILRCADLLELTVTNHGDLIRHSKGLFLIMRHQDCCSSQVAQDPRDLAAHLRPQLWVQTIERLIKQHNARAGCQGARQSNALLLAAGQFVWVSLRAVF
jgi:hypothetical protein